MRPVRAKALEIKAFALTGRVSLGVHIPRALPWAVSRMPFQGLYDCGLYAGVSPLPVVLSPFQGFPACGLVALSSNVKRPFGPSAGLAFVPGALFLFVRKDGCTMLKNLVSGGL